MQESTCQVREGGVGEDVAKVATHVATPAYPVRTVGKFGVVSIVPPNPRVEWGISEAQMAIGYAQSGQPAQRDEDGAASGGCQQ
jgi:hypothetical protein